MISHKIQDFLIPELWRDWNNQCTQSLEQRIFGYRVRKSALPVLTFTWKEMGKYIKCQARMSSWSVKSIYQAASDSWGHSPHFWLSSSHRVRGGLKLKGREPGSLGHSGVNTGESEDLQECPLQLRAKEEARWPRNGKQSMIGFCYMETDLKSSMQRGTIMSWSRKRNVFRVRWEERKEGWKTLLFQPVCYSCLESSSLVSITRASLRCVLALPKTACLTPAYVTVFFLHPCGLNGLKKNTAIS